MIGPTRFVDALQQAGVRFVSGVPDSLLREVCRAIDASLPVDRHVIAANEGGAVALAAGHHLATGTVPLVYLQNSGLGNAVNPLTSLVDPDVYALPLVLLIGWRGQPGVPDEPQHLVQGRVTPGLLDALAIPYRTLDADEAAALDAARWAVREAGRRSGPVALLVTRGAFAAADAADAADAAGIDGGVRTLTRADAIAVIADALHASSAIVASTGMIGRELDAYRRERDEPPGRDFLCIGSMGHASQIALGVALARPERLVVCLDGDGAALMHLGGLATIAAASPRNLVHIVLNNGTHDSVGGQPTAAPTIDLPAVARAVGYARVRGPVETADTVTEAVRALQMQEGPCFLDVRVARGAKGSVGRPTEVPQRAKEGFARHLRTAPGTALGIEPAIERAVELVQHRMHEANVFETAQIKNRIAIYRHVARQRNLALGTFGARAVDMFTLRSPEAVEVFKSGMSSRVPAALLGLTSNKELTKVWLAAHDVLVARGGVATDVEQGLRWFATLGRDVAVKPILGTKGRGISVGLRTESEFRSAFERAKRFNSTVLVEEMIRGIDLRVVVIGDRVCAAVWRIPAHVVGDGRSSVQQLVAEKNDERAKNPYLGHMPLRLDANARRVLRDQGLTDDSVPASGRRVYLTMMANLSSGGDSVNVLDTLHPGVIRMIERAAAAIGHGLYLGFDVLLEHLDRAPEEQRCIVCEVNTNAGPNPARYPGYGAPFDVADAIAADVLEAGSKAAAQRHEATFTLAGVTNREGFETWLAEQAGSAVETALSDDAGGLHAHLAGRFRRVEQVAESLWRWRGPGGERIDAVRRSSPPIPPGSASLPAMVRPTAAPSPPGDTLEAALTPVGVSAEDPESVLLQAAFGRRGWRMQPRRARWYLIDDGTRTGLCYSVHASVAAQRLARLRFPLLRWLGDAGLPTPRHAVFARRERAAALAYLRRRGAPQRLRRSWERARWCLEGVDEAALTAAWRPWPRRLKAMVLEDDVAGVPVGFLVIAGRADLLPPSRGATHAPHPSWKGTAERVAAALPGVDLALVWLRVDDPSAVAETVGWTVVDVDPEPALHRLDALAPGTAAAAADRVVQELYLTNRSFWFAGAKPSTSLEQR